MIRSAFVVSVNDDNSQAQVLPMITGACLSCKEQCAQRGTPFTVSNDKNFEIKEGSIVTIATSPKAEAVQSIISLCTPILCAIAAFFISPSISMAVFHQAATEGFKAACALAGIIIPATIVFAVSRFKIRPSRPYIEKVF